MKSWRGWASGSRGSTWIRSAWLIALLAASAGAAPAQGPESLPAPPGEMTLWLPAQSVLEAGDQMARILAANSQVPADLDIVLDRVRVRISAGQSFLVFCDFFAQAAATGAYPERVALERAPIRAMADEPAVPIAAPPNAAKPPAVQTSRLLAQCPPAADMIRRTRTLPGGIWVQGQRLRPPEFLGALATVLQQLRYFGVAPDLVAVRPYRPPPQWAEALTAAAAPSNAAPAGLPPAAGTPAPVEPPSIRLIPSQGQAVKGLTPLTAVYHGPHAFLQILLDGKVVAVSNVSPFTYVWDTRLEPDGPHSVVGQAVSGGKILAQAGLSLAAQNGGPAL